MLWPLAIAQLVSWGTLYYSFPLFVGPMLDELGWPVAAANGALTVGLLVTGLVAYPVATVLDRRGGRTLMTLGFKVDYVTVRNAASLSPPQHRDEPLRILAAAWLGKTRLIDNVAV